jgi:lipopolysaccharide export system permease protein
MSLLFSVLMTYGRLSMDSEIIAFKSIGVSQGVMTLPAFLLGALMALVSAQTYFYLGPWGNRQTNDLIAALGSTQVISQIREGTFADSFYNLVVYANEVNDKKGVLKDVFIYDERSKNLPLTIIAREGQVLTSDDLAKSTILRLFDGSIHRTTEGVYTKIQFDNYDIFLKPNISKVEDKVSPKSLTIRELYNEKAKPDLTKERRNTLESEYHKRWALPFACIIFALIGVGMGTVVNRRMAKSGGFVISVGLIVIYWVFYMAMDALANNGSLPAIVALWIPNFVFAIWAYYSLRQIWNK